MLMTALTAGIGLVPLVVGGKKPGREILYPVATVILGRAGDLDVVRVPDPPRAVLAVQRQGRRRMVEIEGSDEELVGNRLGCVDDKLFPVSREVTDDVMKTLNLFSRLYDRATVGAGCSQSGDER